MFKFFKDFVLVIAYSTHVHCLIFIIKQLTALGSSERCHVSIKPRIITINHCSIGGFWGWKLQSGNQRFTTSGAGSLLLAMNRLGDWGAGIKQIKWRKSVCELKIARGAFRTLTNKHSTPVNQPVTGRNFTTDLFGLRTSARMPDCLSPGRSNAPYSPLSHHFPAGLISKEHHLKVLFTLTNSSPSPEHSAER